MIGKYAFFDGKIVPVEEAKVSVRTHAFNYGTGCFEGIRGYWNAEEGQMLIFKLREHYERFLRSCRILMIDLPYSADDLCEITLDLVRREGYQEDTYIRPLAYKADEIIGVKLHDMSDAVTIFATPFGRYVNAEEGARVHTSSWRRIDDNAVPARAKITGAYINSAFSKTEAVLNGFDEAIVLTQDGHVSEGSAENLFMVRDGVLVTPPVSENILEGITREVVLQLGRDELGLRTVQRKIDRSELFVAEEVFFTGTGVQIAAIIEIDRRPVGEGRMGPVTERMRDLYFDVVRGRVPAYRPWCTPVYTEAIAGVPASA
ncbi:MAG: branched-chain amino acid transaminase [Chloroflexi bacterium]|nr:branched-chain amino acid transaminase [Chloroflexota bacterium]